MRLFFAPTLILLLAPAARAQLSTGELELPAILADGMVLQRETACPLWGHTTPGVEVRVRASWGASAGGYADGDGHWRVDLGTPEAGGPYSIEIDAGATRVLEDVWIGEVWVCSGQSNMEWPVRATNNGPALLEEVNEPRLRVFDVVRRISLKPEEDCAGQWRPATAESLAGFSAVGTFFGLELLSALDVPVGLIGTNWGGTPVEAWTSLDTLSTTGDFEDLLARIAAARANPEAQPSIEDLQRDWWVNFERTDPGAVATWNARDLDIGTWEATAVPTTFSEHGLGSFDGAVWYRAQIQLPADWVGTELILELGPIDDMDHAWFDGVQVGGLATSGSWNTPRLYRVPGTAVTRRNVTLAVCAVDTGGVGRFGSDALPMRVYPAGDESRARALPATWHWKAGAKLGALGRWPASGWFNAGSPSALFNGMIAPLVPFGIRGALWYQGEANVSRAAQYRRLFPAMIRDWRRHFEREEFPFYFVQIAPFAYGGDIGQAAELREAQTLALALPATGMAVTMDLGNPTDIHPREKREVGRRLARWALARDYGKLDLAVSGPLLDRASVEGASMRIFFEHASGLRSSQGPLSHFTMAGEDRVFHPAEATVDGDTLVVRSAEVAHPVAVRYAWGAADEPNLVNGAGLPAPSFRTDDWPPVSSDG